MKVSVHVFRHVLLGASCAPSMSATMPWLLSAVAVAWSPQAIAVEQTLEQAPRAEATLQQVIAMAQENSPKVVVGRSQLRTSRTSLVGARLWPVQNPYFEITATGTRRDVGSGTLIQGSAWLPFEISGQRSHRISQAEAFVGIHEVGVQQTKAEATGAAMRAWGRALVETARIRTLTEIASSAEQEAKAFRARRNAGDATERDAQLAEVEFARHRMLVEESQVALDSALGEMKRLTGRYWFIPQHALVRPGYDLNRLNPVQAAAQSPHVKSSRTEAEYHARTEERLASEATGPVSLIVTGGQGTLGETMFGGGVAFTLPSFRRNQGERAHALAEHDRALVQSDVTRRDIASRLTTLLREARGLRRAEAVLDKQALPAAKAARHAAEQMFEMGKIDILAVLVSRRDEAVLRLRQLDLAEQEWELMAEWSELSGSAP